VKKELVFVVEQDGDAWVAVCHEPEMATQGETLDELLVMIRDLVQCRFDEADERRQWPIRLHFLHDPVSQARGDEAAARSFRRGGVPGITTAWFCVCAANWVACALCQGRVACMRADVP